MKDSKKRRREWEKRREDEERRQKTEPTEGSLPGMRTVRSLIFRLPAVREEIGTFRSENRFSSIPDMCHTLREQGEKKRRLSEKKKQRKKGEEEGGLGVAEGEEVGRRGKR